MTLNFMQQFPDGTPTNFLSKIVSGIMKNNLCSEEELESIYTAPKTSIFRPIYFVSGLEVNDKLHTIRRGYRWKEGTQIHFKVWEGKPYKSKTFNFAPIIPCKGVQEIEFKWRKTATGRCVNVFIDGKDVTTNVELIDNLALNDGFHNRKDFFEWFKDDFKGQIIHWTDLKY